MKPSLTVDGVLIRDDAILLVKRKHEPFRGKWALPGGFVEYGETVEQAIRREFLEETGLSPHIIRLLGVYSDPSRDPRGHTVSVVFLLSAEGEPQAGDDAAAVRFFTLDDLPPLAFDHKKIIMDALAAVKNWHEG